LHCSCLGKGARLWLVARPSIHLFRIPHFTFTLALCFHSSLIQPLTFSFFVCECGHELDASNMHLLHYLFGDHWIVTHDAIEDVMYVLVPKSANFVWREWWYAITLKISLWADLYMAQEDQVFVTNVVVIDPMWEMASSVISRPTIAVVKLSAITKICKYKRFQEGHHFISMATNAHLSVIWIVSSRSVFVFPTIGDHKIIYPYFFRFNFSSSVLVLLFSML
jgi:hypothetical protein